MPCAPTSRGFRFAHQPLVLAASALLLAASACGSDSPTAPKDVPGTYVLRTIDGLSPPVAVPNPRDHAIVINSVTATLNANNTYAVAGTGTEDGDASTVVTDAGTYTQSGSTLHFTSTTLGGATYSATAKTDTMVLSLPGGFMDSDSPTFALLFEKVNLGPGSSIER
ncbi:MAG: hypothetical protein ABI889_06285 [Gemmatimonadota bacterium]